MQAYYFPCVSVACACQSQPLTSTVKTVSTEREAETGRQREKDRKILRQRVKRERLERQAACLTSVSAVCRGQTQAAVQVAQGRHQGLCVGRLQLSCYNTH